MSETEYYEEVERHIEATRNAKWYEPTNQKIRIRISYNHENLWPNATLTALKAFDRLGGSIVSKVVNAREILLVEQRIQFAEQGVHVVNGKGECSCGLVVEVQRIDGREIESETLKAIAISTPGHFDHRTRSFTDLLIVGEVGPSEPHGYWVHKPGPLISTSWHCVYCGRLGEATRVKGFANRFRKFENSDAHHRQWAALNVTNRRWNALKKTELKKWAQALTGGKAND